MKVARYDLNNRRYLFVIHLVFAILVIFVIHRALFYIIAIVVLMIMTVITKTGLISLLLFIIVAGPGLFGMNLARLGNAQNKEGMRL